MPNFLINVFNKYVFVFFRKCVLFFLHKIRLFLFCNSIDMVNDSSLRNAALEDERFCHEFLVRLVGLQKTVKRKCHKRVRLCRIQ